jgi:hypothetical protein
MRPNGRSRKMPPSSTRLKYAPQIEQRLADLALRLRIPMIERRIREQLFTETERKRIEAQEKSPRDVVALWSKIKNVSPARAIADLAFEADLLSAGQHVLLVRDLGEAKRTVNSALKPEWNRETCELRYGGQVVRKTRGVKIAKNITAVLDEFESKNWPDRIDNPLHDQDPQTLREAIATLNERLTKLRFRSDGSGTGVAWGLHTGRASTARRP